MSVSKNFFSFVLLKDYNNVIIQVSGQSTFVVSSDPSNKIEAEIADKADKQFV
jgi:hypothetical protein